jgi:hypothetical protein
MAGAILLSLMAAQLGSSGSPAAHQPWNSGVSAQATASVRILSAARVHLGHGAQPEGYALHAAHVRLEDGRRHPAKLIEFQ